MANTFILEFLPKPVVATEGSNISLASILSQQFGPSLGGFSDFWLMSTGADVIRDNSFSYWNVDHPSVTSWLLNGKEISGQIHVGLDDVQNVTLHVGNNIGPFTYLTIPVSTSAVPWDVNIQYQINVVDPALMSAHASLGAPTPDDVVEAAHRFAEFYGPIANTSDCWNIATDVAAAAGASLPVLSGSFDPTENIDAGFWRVSYRGSESNSSAPLHTLVKPGDILRFEWLNGTAEFPGHSTTVLAVNNNGSLTVFDNSDTVAGQTAIGIHTWNIDNAIIPSTLTIYRLSTDNLYIINGTELGEKLVGTSYNDDIRAGGGDDIITGGYGNDVIHPGAGNDEVFGGDGLDTVILGADRSASSVEVNANSATIKSAEGVDTIHDVERVEFSHSTVALDVDGNAGQAYRLYQAAFDRTPDPAGLGYWISSLDTGKGDLTWVAHNFILSDEFRAMYGDPSTVTNDKFLSLIYQNVLDREPDGAGYKYWIDSLNDGFAREKVLASFSESVENQQNVAADIAHGIEFVPWFA